MTTPPAYQKPGQARADRGTPLGLTDQEKLILNHVMKAHAGFLSLSEIHPSDMQDWADAIHRLQNLIAFRVARRVDPGFWWEPKP
jgi:hypothetical protein